jgi:hypothetical protein
MHEHTNLAFLDSVRICINLVKAPGECINLPWLFCSAAVEGVSHELSLTFTPPPNEAQPHLIFLDYGLVEEDSWLHTWFRMPPASPTALALCPAVLKLLRLKFQPVLLQHPETTGENVTRYWMVGFPWPLEKVRDISIVV